MSANAIHVCREAPAEEAHGKGGGGGVKGGRGVLDCSEAVILSCTSIPMGFAAPYALPIIPFASLPDDSWTLHSSSICRRMGIAT